MWCPFGSLLYMTTSNLWGSRVTKGNAYSNHQGGSCYRSHVLHDGCNYSAKAFGKARASIWKHMCSYMHVHNHTEYAPGLPAAKHVLLVRTTMTVNERANEPNLETSFAKKGTKRSKTLNKSTRATCKSDLIDVGDKFTVQTPSAITLYSHGATSPDTYSNSALRDRPFILTPPSSFPK